MGHVGTMSASVCQEEGVRVSGVAGSSHSRILIRTLPCVRGCRGGAIIVGCNKGTVMGRRLRSTMVASVILLHSIKMGVILIRNNKPRVSSVLGHINGRDHFMSKLHCASRRAVSVIRVILTNGIGGRLMRLVSGRNNGTVNLYNVSNRVVGTMGCAGSSIKFMNRVARVSASIVSCALRGGCVPIVSSITANRGNRIFGVGTSATTTTVTTDLRTRGLLLVASVDKLLVSGSSSSALVRSIRISRVPSLGSRNIVSNNVVPGVSYYMRTIHHKILRAGVVSKHVPRSVLVRLFASRNFNAVFRK